MTLVSLCSELKTRFRGGQNPTAVEGNASVYQVNTVSRTTGEGRGEFVRTWGLYVNTDRYHFDILHLGRHRLVEGGWRGVLSHATGRELKLDTEEWA